MTIPVFPTLPGITYPVKRGIRWDMTKQDALSGKRVRQSYFTYPIYNYEVIFSFLRSDSVNAEWQSFSGFINSVAGGTSLFLYNDVNDNNTNGDQNFGTGDGTSTTFRLVRSLGGFVEPVFFSNVINSIKINGTPTAAYTISATGQIVFNTAPALAATLTWNGSFYFPCRFDEDVFGLEQFMQKIWELKKAAFSTEKLNP